MLPNPATDLPTTHLRVLIRTYPQRIVEKLEEFLGFFRHENLRSLASSFVQILEWVYGIRGNHWDLARSFKTALVFYFVIIPLPAAFLLPVGGVQIDPSLQLLAATVMLIFANAIGDMFSVNCSAKIIRTALNLPRFANPESAVNNKRSNASVVKASAFDEVRFYCFLL